MNASNFTSFERDHYRRHLTLPEIGQNGQTKLKEASVLVVGAGGLGCPVLQYLVAAGVGRIGIVDDDCVELSNLQRQTLFTYNDLGRPKVEVAVERLTQQNPHIVIQSHKARVEVENVNELFDDYSIIVDGSDNFPTRYLINDACVLFEKVLIHGSIHKFHGQVAVFNYRKGPTYRCLFPEPPSSDALPNCSEIGVLGVLPGIIGSLQALETIKVITGVGDILSGKVLTYDALLQKTTLLTLSPQAENRQITELVSQSESCSNSEGDPNEITELEPNELRQWMKSKNEFLLLDVRETWEREECRIEPSLHIPLGEFSSPENLDLPVENSSAEKIVVYCKAGVRSMMACQSLSALGFQNLYNLSGGMMRWGDGS